MYNVILHSTTRTPPTKLMFNRVIRDKLPGIQDLTGEYVDKVIADKKRDAYESDISVGVKIILENVVFYYKVTQNLDTTEYVVTAKKGNLLEVSIGD